MKTTDGHEIEIGAYYYLENGQVVILDVCATTHDKKPAFMVTPFYEGETMTVSGDGGSHHEYSADYEHEGELTLVKSIFKVAPMERLDETYKTKLMRIESLAVSFGEIQKLLGLAHVKKAGIEREIELLSKTCKRLKENDLQAREMLDSTIELVNKKRNELSDLEDSIGDFIGTEKETAINKTELQRLNKRDFELQCLENGGVDNWEWYSESLKDFNKRYPDN